MELSEKMLSAGKGALFLTALSAISQVLGFFYRVALSRLVGAEVMGLYQLIMPVCSVIMSLTAVGLTAAVSNLTSQHLALGNRRAADQTIAACLKFFFLLLLPVKSPDHTHTREILPGSGEHMVQFRLHPFIQRNR